MLRLIFSNLKQRPTRTLVSVLAVAMGVTLVLVTVGLSYGQLNDQATRMGGMGDIMVQPSDASFMLAISSGTFPVKVQRVIQPVQGVAAVTPILTKFLGDKFHLVFGVDLESFRSVSSNLKLVDGEWFSRPDQLLIDTNYARSRKLNVGDSMEILGNSFTVSGIFQEGVAARVLLPLHTLQELNGTPDKCTMFLIRVDDKSQLDQVDARLQARLKKYRITKTEDLQELMTSQTPVFQPFIRSIVVLASLISFLMILLAMYSTITERTREIGILKSLGASKSYIIQLILKESFLICAMGVGVGFILTSVANQLVLAAYPSLPVDVSALWRFSAATVSVLGGCLGAMYPALKAAQLDPIKALGYE